ncbi:MAG: hemolysin family protein [Alphaproteobacteria bacterium]|nr:hemolysin family protein [Alphaproteobacteria bacterium]
MFSEIIILVALIALNAVFAMGEMAIVAARKSRLTVRAEQGDVGARRALELASNPTQFLSTVQTGITFINVLMGVFGGLTLAERLAQYMRKYPALEPYAQSFSVALVVTCLTLASLILGELAPKRIAIGHAEVTASRLAPLMHVVSVFAKPMVWVLSHSTDLVLAIFRVKATEPAPITDNEIRILMREGTLAGSFHESERVIVTLALKLGDRRVSALMTPRTRMEIIDLNEPIDEIIARLREGKKSRYPVMENEQVVGILEMRQLAHLLLSPAADINPLTRHDAALSVETLRNSLKNPIFLPDSAPAPKLLETFQRTGQQIALIVDEYGDLEGLVTQTDLLEALVGDFAEADGEHEQNAVQRPDGSWIINGLMPIDELTDLFNTGANWFEEGEELGFHTVGGFVMAHLKRIPQMGDHFEHAGMKIDVIHMDGHRVKTIRISQTP